MKNALRMFVLAAAALAVTGRLLRTGDDSRGSEGLASQKDMLVKIANAMPETSSADARSAFR